MPSPAPIFKVTTPLDPPPVKPAPAVTPVIVPLAKFESLLKIERGIPLISCFLEILSLLAIK
jgi:hypothetical protein